MSSLLRPYSRRLSHATRRYPPGALAKSLVLGKPLPDVDFHDFVTVRSGGCFTGSYGGDRDEGGGIIVGGGGLKGGAGRGGGELAWPSARELVGEFRCLWLEYCYGSTS